MDKLLPDFVTHTCLMGTNGPIMPHIHYLDTQMSIFDRIETQTLCIILALSKVESSSGLSIVIYSKSLCTLRHISRKRQKSNTNS